MNLSEEHRNMCGKFGDPEMIKVVVETHYVSLDEI